MNKGKYQYAVCPYCGETKELTMVEVVPADRTIIIQCRNARCLQKYEIFFNEVDK